MRIVLVLLAAYQGLNGVVMLAAPDFWYGAVPGVLEAGPLNPHFVRDIGLGFLAAALALGLAARAAAPYSLLAVATAFTGGHALLHLAEIAVHGGAPTALLRDMLTIIIPGIAPAALIAILVATPSTRPV